MCSVNGAILSCLQNDRNRLSLLASSAIARFLIDVSRRYCLLKLCRMNSNSVSRHPFALHIWHKNIQANFSLTPWTDMSTYYYITLVPLILLECPISDLLIIMRVISVGRVFCLRLNNHLVVFY